MTQNDRVKAVREALGLNQTEFGQKLAVKQASLSAIELGKRAVTDKIIKLICFNFGVSETWLRTGEGEMFAASPASIVEELCNQYDIGDYGRGILTTFCELPKYQRDAFLDFVQAFSGKHAEVVSDSLYKAVSERIDEADDTQDDQQNG